MPAEPVTMRAGAVKTIEANEKDKEASANGFTNLKSSPKAGRFLNCSTARL
jgi:hypothetical protein